MRALRGSRYNVSNIAQLTPELRRVELKVCVGANERAVKLGRKVYLL